VNAHLQEQKEAIVARTEEAVQISAIVPTLTVDDLQKSIVFYEALGFAIEDRWEDQGTLLGVMPRSPRPGCHTSWSSSCWRRTSTWRLAG
jgi:hypothetical protein